MKIEFHEVAREELAQAIAYYDQQQEGLGEEFYTEFWRAIESIGDYPEAWRRLSKNTRRCRLHRFPNGVVYRARDNKILIVAVMHLHREPDYFRDR